MTLSNFYVNTTKKINVTITESGSNPDITGDTVTIYFKTSKTVTDANATISKEADVATSGASGTAIFTLTDEETDVTYGKYYYEIIWDKSTGEKYVLESGTVNLLQTVSD